MKEEILLRDPDQYPSGKLLEQALGKDVFRLLERFIAAVTDESYGLELEWRFYKDGKAWLGKMTYKKKTVLWLSIWDGYFKTSFHFAVKHIEKIQGLDISERIKEDLQAAKPSGKLISLILDVRGSDQLDDLLTVVRWKKSLK